MIKKYKNLEKVPKKIWFFLSAIIGFLVGTYFPIKSRYENCKKEIRAEIEFYEKLDFLLDRSYNRFIEFSKFMSFQRNKSLFSFFEVNIDKNIPLKELLRESFYIKSYNIKIKSDYMKVKLENGRCLFKIFLVEIPYEVSISNIYKTKVLVKYILVENSSNPTIIIDPSFRFFEYLKNMLNKSDPKVCEYAKDLLKKGAKAFIKKDKIKDYIKYKIRQTEGIYKAIRVIKTNNANKIILLKYTNKDVIQEWTTRMSSTFRNIHNQMEELILKNLKFINKDKKMKYVIRMLLKHIDGYKRVFKKWEKGDYSELISDVNFPKELDYLVKEKIKSLKKKSKSLKYCILEIF